MADAGSNITDLTSGVYRRMYAKFIKGKRINALSLEAEAWFWRVHAAADDFGNADGEPGLVHAATAGRRRATMEQVAGWLNEMKVQGLIRFYESAGDTYLHVVGFGERQPAPRNGKRVRHFPSSPWDDVGGVQGNPGASRCSDSDSDSDSHSDPDTEVKPAAQVSAVPAVAARAATSTHPNGNDSPVVLVFPVIAGRRSDNREWQLRQTVVDQLQSTFPALDVLAHCREAHGWIHANEGKRKTAGGMERFLWNWMKTEQNRGRGRGQNGHPSPRVQKQANHLEALNRRLQP